MKKLLLIGLIVLVGALGASVMTGRMFVDQLVNLESEINADPRLKAVTSTSHQGLFSSSGTMTVTMNLEDGQQLLIENPWQASHRPGWVNYQGQTLLTLEVDNEETINLLEELDLGTLAYQGKAGWKKATFLMAVKPFLFEDDYAKLEVTGVDLAGTYHYSGRHVGKLIAENIVFMEKNYGSTELELKNLAFNWDQKGRYPFVQGNADFIAEHIHFSSQHGQVELSKPSLNQAVVFNEQAFDYQMSLNLGDVKSQGEKLGTGKFVLKTANFNGQAMADLLDVIATNTSRYELIEEKGAQAIMTALDKLLGGSPALVLEEFNFNLKTPFVFEQDATGELSFDGSNLPIHYLQQLNEGRLDSDDAISRTRLEINFSKIEPSLLMLVGIPVSMLNPEPEEQQLVFELGELKLNGQVLPLF